MLHILKSFASDFEKFVTHFEKSCHYSRGHGLVFSRFKLTLFFFSGFFSFHLVVFFHPVTKVINPSLSLGFGLPELRDAWASGCLGFGLPGL